MAFTKTLIAALAIMSVTACASTATHPVVAATPETPRAYIIQEAKAMGIEEHVIVHVANKESTFRCSPGNPTYSGPLQISYNSAKALGYSGPKSGLNNCGDGLKYGLRHLAICVRKVGQDAHKAAACHASPARYGVVVRWSN